VRQIAGYAAEIGLGLGGEGGIETLIEFLEREPPVREVLAQFSSDGLALGVSDTQTRLRCHLPLRALRADWAKRYIAISAGATSTRATERESSQPRLLAMLSV
jgi:hypothetical protein